MGMTKQQMELEIKRLRAEVDQLKRPKSVAKIFSGLTAPNLRFFRMMEDVTGNGPFWARRTNRADSSLSDWQQVYNWDGILTGAQAGYHALFKRVDNEWVIGDGDCFDACTHDGSITVGTPPDGTVDSEYAGHTVTNTGVTSLSASGLPAGLSMNGSGVISGTPTEAGTFYVVITGTDGDCTLTRVMPLTVNEA